MALKPGPQDKELEYKLSRSVTKHEINPQDEEFVVFMKHFRLICDEVFFVDVIAFYLYAEYFHHFVCFAFCRTLFI